MNEPPPPPPTGVYPSLGFEGVADPGVAQRKLLYCYTTWYYYLSDIVSRLL